MPLSPREPKIHAELWCTQWCVCCGAYAVTVVLHGRCSELALTKMHDASVNFLNWRPTSQALPSGYTSCTRVTPSHSETGELGRPLRGQAPPAGRCLREFACCVGLYTYRNAREGPVINS